MVWFVGATDVFYTVSLTFTAEKTQICPKSTGQTQICLKLTGKIKKMIVLYSIFIENTHKRTYAYIQQRIKRYNEMTAPERCMTDKQTGCN